MAKTKRNEAKTGAEELFRRLKSNPPLFVGTVLVLVLVIVSFVLVPAIPDIRGDAGGADFTFGFYDGVPIAYTPDNYFGRAVENFSRMEGLSQESLSGLENGENDMRVWQRAFYSALTHEAVLAEMRNAGYRASAALVDREVAKLPMFQDNGRFSVTKFRSYSKTALPVLRKAAEEDYLERQYRDAFAALRVSEAEKAFVAGMSSPERNFRMASFPRSSYPDSGVAAYAAANPAPFSVLHLSKITVTSSEKEAGQVLDAVKSGKTAFEEAARNQSQDTYRDQGGDMGIRMAWELYTSLPDEGERAAVTALKSGEYSGVVRDPAGWAFYRAEAAPYNADFSLPENIGKARSYMTEQAGGQMENWLVARAEEFTGRAKSEGFDAAAREAGVEVQYFGPVNLNYGNVALFTPLNLGGQEQTAISNENFWRIAFTVPVNACSAPFTLGTDVVVLEPVEEIVKDDTAKDYIADFFANGYWMYSANESALGGAVTGSKKTRDQFLMTYLGRILSPLSNLQ